MNEPTANESTSEPSKTDPAKGEPPKTGSAKTEAEKDGSAQFLTAADKLRETSKWLAATFGALGAALIASLSLSDLQGLTGLHLALALMGFALGLLGTGIVVASVARVLMTTSASVSDISSDMDAQNLLRANVSMLGGFDTSAELFGRYTTAQKERVDAYVTLLDESDKPLDAATQHAYERARKMLLFTSPIVERVLAFVAFDRLRRRFNQALGGIAVGIFIAGIGMGLFAYFSNAQDEDTSEAVITGAPVEGQMNLAPTGEEVLRDLLGVGCDLDSVPVLVVDSHEDSVEVISVSGDGCQVRRFTITSEMGAVCPASPAIQAALPADADDPDGTGGVVSC
jgi:hypothetical protein